MQRETMPWPLFYCMYSPFVQIALPCMSLSGTEFASFTESVILLILCKSDWNSLVLWIELWIWLCCNIFCLNESSLAHCLIPSVLTLAYVFLFITFAGSAVTSYSLSHQKQHSWLAPGLITDSHTPCRKHSACWWPALRFVTTSILIHKKTCNPTLLNVYLAYMV